MYDRCDDTFYTPERCVYGSDIPCYTQYNNVIPLDRRYIRHDTPSHDMLYEWYTTYNVVI